MLKVILGIFVFVYVTVLVISYVSVVGNGDPNSRSKVQLDSRFIDSVQDQVNPKSSLRQPAKPTKPVREPSDESDNKVETTLPKETKRPNISKKLAPKTPNINFAKANFMRMNNPFFLLGAYPELTKNYAPETYYNERNYGITNDDNYCDRVDMEILKNPNNVFEQKVFYTDFPNNQLPTKLVMSKIGNVPKLKVSTDYATDKIVRGLDERVNSFFMQYSSFHLHHKIGQNFLCASQVYNHIPGVDSLVTKDQVVDKINNYIKKYEDRSHCFNKRTLFPYTYRLYNKEECTAFFKKIHSREYKASLKKEAIQYVIKVGHGSHKSEGVYLLDKKETDWVNNKYEFGQLCGIEQDSLLAQTYIGNPLLLNFNNKFDFRVYMLIVSTNPLIVYYHDGFVKTSLFAYEKSSAERGTHITNTYLANQKIAEAKKKGELIYGMTEEQLKEYILWDFEKLEAYLLESKKVKDVNWLNNYLRPAFHKAFIHLTRATQGTYWKGSNVYALQGADFMLDDEMNLWFIESNPSPLLSGTTKWKIYLSVVSDHFEVVYAYMKSRMKRAMEVISKIQNEVANGNPVNYADYREEFQEALKNRLEPEYQISKKNSWVKIVDENLKGTKVYNDYLTPECL